MQQEYKFVMQLQPLVSILVYVQVKEYHYTLVDTVQLLQLLPISITQ